MTDRPALRHVSFDLDGTLIDSFDVMRQSWEAATRALSINCGFERYRTYVGLPFARILEKLGLSNYLAELSEMYFAGTLARQAEIGRVAGAAEILDHCRSAGLGTSVITSKPRSNAAPLLDAVGLLVDELLCADDVSKGKPDPMSARVLCEKVGLAPQQVLYVGDMVYDFQFALNAGMAFVHFDHGGSSRMPRNLLNTVTRISRLQDLEPLLS